MPPIIAITPDTTDAPPKRHPTQTTESQRIVMPYPLVDAVTQAGGIPILIPHDTSQIPHYLTLADAVILSGGDDPDTTTFNTPLHPHADPVYPRRQQFELALLKALDHTQHPVLGICLGMQYMALHHGGALNQHLPDTCPPDIAEQHAYGTHPIESPPNPYLSPGPVFSHHHQAVANPGSLQTIATANDIIEAVCRTDPSRFYLGVQWHPERTEHEPLGIDILKALITACD